MNGGKRHGSGVGERTNIRRNVFIVVVALSSFSSHARTVSRALMMPDYLNACRSAAFIYSFDKLLRIETSFLRNYYVLKIVTSNFY